MNQRERNRSAAYFITITVLFLFSVWAFIEIVDELKRHKIEHFDTAIITFVQSWISPDLTAFMKGITFFGSAKWITTCVIVVSLLLWLKKERLYALFFALTVSLGTAFNHLLKQIFERKRPDIQPLIHEKGFSFPSGHSMASFVMYGAIAFLLFELLEHRPAKRFGAVMASLFILLVGLSRIYLGVHYPSDVIGGYAAAAIWLIFSLFIFHLVEFIVKKKFHKRPLDRE
ncbi:phosphatase PAP2 family protein [Bacillus smithii]|uniref:phosphatase PAP2 family protein n=1 Tax=Bacillus smithii TaxID=1479 RepID=UPI003D200579